MSEAARRRVRGKQEAMLRVLLNVSAAPPALHHSSLKNAQEALLRKRIWSCSLAWPALAKTLGSTEFTTLFTEYAANQPYQPTDGALVDGRDFSCWLASMGRLPDLGRIQLLAFKLKYRTQNGTKRRRVVGKVAAYRLRNPPYLCIGVSLPFLRIKQIIRLPLSGRRMA